MKPLRVSPRARAAASTSASTSSGTVIAILELAIGMTPYIPRLGYPFNRTNW